MRLWLGLKAVALGPHPSLMGKLRFLGNVGLTTDGECRRNAVPSTGLRVKSYAEPDAVDAGRRRGAVAIRGPHGDRGAVPDATAAHPARASSTARIGGGLRVGTAVPVTGPLQQTSMHIIQAKTVGELEFDRFTHVVIGAVILVSTERGITTCIDTLKKRSMPLLGIGV